MTFEPVARATPAARTFDACYREHRERLFRLALRYGAGDAAFAEDVTHDVLLKLLEHLPRLGEHEDLGGWLYRVTVNTALSRLRHERSVFGRVLKRLKAEPEPAAPAPDVLFEQHEAAAAAMHTLRAMPPRERIVICMKILDGKSQQEIAAALSLSEGYVSKLVTRAWDRIRASGWEVDDAEA
ncbi:MAG TPA: sigma-70 family RNA polymerase sigma factor [Polyangia bacterium]